MYFLAAPQAAGLICTFHLCPDTRRPGRAFALQPRTTCAPCREATPCAPAASSPCPTAGRSASRTPALPLSSVSSIRQSRLSLQSLPCVSPRLRIQSVADTRVWRRVRAPFCLPSAESVVPARPGRSSTCPTNRRGRPCRSLTLQMWCFYFRSLHLTSVPTSGPQ